MNNFYQSSQIKAPKTTSALESVLSNNSRENLAELFQTALSENLHEIFVLDENDDHIGHASYINLGSCGGIDGGWAIYQDDENGYSLMSIEKAMSL